MLKPIALLLLFSCSLLAEKPLTDERIVDLVRAGVSPAELSQLIRTARAVNFDLTPGAEAWMMQEGVPEAAIKEMSARESGSALPIIAPGGPKQPGTPANPAPPWQSDVYFGYSYLNADLIGERQGINGWEAAASFTTPVRQLSIEFDGAGYYTGNFGGVSGLNVGDYLLMGGPRGNLGPLFVHALFGASLLGNGAGAASPDVSFANAFGGGFQSKPFAHGRIALRSSVDYVVTRHGAVTENSVRVSGGVVFRLPSGSGAGF
jgi:hypothetical protein